MCDAALQAALFCQSILRLQKTRQDELMGTTSAASDGRYSVKAAKKEQKRQCASLPVSFWYFPDNLYRKLDACALAAWQRAQPSFAIVKRICNFLPLVYIKSQLLRSKLVVDERSGQIESVACAQELCQHHSTVFLGKEWVEQLTTRSLVFKVLHVQVALPAGQL